LFLSRSPELEPGVVSVAALCESVEKAIIEGVSGEIAAWRRDIAMFRLPILSRARLMYFRSQKRWNSCESRKDITCVPAGSMKGKTVELWLAAI
jgi:hypothetical protein